MSVELGAGSSERQHRQREELRLCAAGHRFGWETHYWLRLLRDSKTIGPEQIDPLIEEAEELVRILTAIVKTAQRRGADRPTPDNSKLKTQNYKLERRK